MQKILNNKIILHNIKNIRENLDKIEELTLEEYDKNNQKRVQRIQKELDGMEYYYKAYLNEDKTNFPIKKQITIKSKKTSNSFANWLFNNNDI